MRKMKFLKDGKHPLRFVQAYLLFKFQVKQPIQFSSSWFTRALRTLAMYEAKTAKISNFWTFWPIIQVIKRCFLAELYICHIVQTLLIFAVFASYIASVNPTREKKHRFCMIPLTVLCLSRDTALSLLVSKLGCTHWVPGSC